MPGRGGVRVYRTDGQALEGHRGPAVIPVGAGAGAVPAVGGAAGEVADDSGRALAAMVEAARAPAAASGTGPEAVPFEQLSADRQAAVRAWVDQAVLGICEELRASGQWAEGQTDDRGRGWEKLQADAALRLGQLARAMWGTTWTWSRRRRRS